MLNEFYARITTWVMAAREESGQGLVEYALILVLVSLVAIAGLELMGTSVLGKFNDIAGELSGAVAPE